MNRKARFIVLAMVIAANCSLVGLHAGPGPVGMDALGIFGSFVGNTTGSTGASFGLTARWGNFPVLGVAYQFLLKDGFTLGASCDYWAMNEGISGTPLLYFLGIGAYGGIAVLKSEVKPDLGLRVPVGLQIYPVKKFEIFVEGVPMIILFPSVNFGFGADIGARVYF